MLRTIMDQMDVYNAMLQMLQTLLLPLCLNMLEVES